jgi:hypothetical protein
MKKALISSARSVRVLMWLSATLLVALLAARTGASPASETTGPAAAQVAFDQVPLSANDAANGANFGYSVAIDGNTLVVGAYLANSGGQEKAGAAYVFTRPALGSRQWTQVARLSAADGAPSDQFGAAVAISGDTIAVSATHADINGNTNQGAVYLFGRNQGGSNKWGQVKKLYAADGHGFDEFGFALALAGDELLVGAPAADANGYIHNGAVYVYRRNQGGAGNWGQADVLFDPIGRDSDNFAYDLAVDGNWLVVGADRADVTGTYENDGAALLFTRAAPGADWTFVKRLVAADAKPNERFGAAVAIDGDRVLVGAPAAGRNGQFSVGKAYLFGRNQGGAGNWGQFKLLTAGNGQAFDSYGTAVALDGDTAYVGAGKGDMTIVDEGAVYVYQKDHGGTNAWGEALKLGAAGGAPNSNFGHDMAHAGDALVVGANLAESTRGKAYVFTPAAPPQISRTYLPVAFDIFFEATGTLTNGGVVTGPDGIKLGAVEGALDSPLPVAIGEAIPPAQAVPDRAAVIGDYYRVAAGREAVLPLDKSFILALPVPDGANTGNLAVAVYGSTASLLDMDNHTGQFWRFVPGVYDPANRLLLAQFPSLASAGEIVALVEHPDLPSPPRSGGRAASDASSVRFQAACTTSLACNSNLLEEFEGELQRQYTSFDFHGYGLPRLNGTTSNIAIDPPQLGPPNQVFFAFLFDETQPGCIDKGGKSAYSGIYAPDNAYLFICVADGASSLTDFQKDTVRHEYFHALQYSYDNILIDWMSGEEEDWIIEGMAEVVINSGWDWARSGSNVIRPVDKSLTDEDDLLTYRTEDFWAFYGRNRASGAGIERLQPILLAGSTFQDVFAHTGWAEDYWLWVRNQVIEKNDNMDGALVDGTCQLEEAAVSRMATLDAGIPGNNPLIGTVDPLSAFVVEVIFPSDWAGREVMIMAGALPMDKPAPTGFEYKIYRTPWPNCSSTPDNMHQRYKIVPGERYFVVFTNWIDQQVIPWYVGYE